MVGEDPAQVCLDGPRAIDLAAIEPDDVALGREERGKSGRVTPVPAVQQRRVQPGKRRSRIVGSECGGHDPLSLAV